MDDEGYIDRPKFLRRKDVMLINDTPVKKEIEEGDKFSSASNLNLLTSLRTGRVNPFNKVEIPNHTGIVSTKIYSTYLDYSYYGTPGLENNFDFKQEFKKKKDLKELRTRGSEEDILAPLYWVERDTETLTDKSIERATFYKLEHQKDVYISYRLKGQLDCLLHEIKEVKPKLIILTNKWSLFFLTGMTTLAKTMGNYKNKRPLGGLITYRASIMKLHKCFNLPDCIVYPIYHPVHAMSMVNKIPIMELDTQKAGYVYKQVMEYGVGHYLVPDKKYLSGVDKEQILEFLDGILFLYLEEPRLVSMDIETMFGTIIDCIGIAISTDIGLCIPFASRDTPTLWSIEDEVEIMVKLREVMLHPNCQHVGQNYQYDTTYYATLWNMSIVAEWDTMVLHHNLYNYLPKDLAFLASLYCEFYIYWKGESEATKETPETRWIYNAKDVCYTLEVLQALRVILEQQPQDQQDLYRFQQSKLTPILDGMMLDGIRVDVQRKEELYTYFSKLLNEITTTINDTIDEDFNINSPLQKKKVFADLLGMELVKRKGKETCDASAMLEYLGNYPEYKPFLTLLLEHSSLKVFTNNFLGMELDDDGRARTRYKIAGTSTGRLASTKNVWGRGANLMNIPSKGKIDLRQAVELVDEGDTLTHSLEVEGTIKLPNIKKIFLPNEGMEFADADYSGADIMVVAADANCKWLQDYFAKPRGCGKVYAYIASEFFQREVSPTSKEYKTFKGIFHGTNYLMGIDKLARMAGIPYKLAKGLQDFYFQLNPEIRTWQDRIVRDIRDTGTKGYITNIYGRKGWYLNKNDPMLANKAVAFIPQSTIADLINHAMVAIDKKLPGATITLQVHDSLVVQYPKEEAAFYRKKIIECMEIPLPYTPTLIIPADLQTSTVSYGDVE